MSDPLPPFTPKARCPKCAYNAIGTAFHTSAHAECPAFGGLYRQYESMVWLMTHNEQTLLASGPSGAKRQEYRDRAIAIAERWSEHLDRTCHRCAYSWSEAVAA